VCLGRPNAEARVRGTVLRLRGLVERSPHDLDDEGAHEDYGEDADEHTGDHEPIDGRAFQDGS